MKIHLFFQSPICKTLLSTLDSQEQLNIGQELERFLANAYKDMCFQAPVLHLYVFVSFNTLV